MILTVLAVLILLACAIIDVTLRSLGPNEWRTQCRKNRRRQKGGHQFQCSVGPPSSVLAEEGYVSRNYT